MTYRGFITRADWGARAPRSRSLNISPEGTLTHWMGNRVGHITHNGCYEYIRAVQNFHMNDRGWVDIAYSVLPCRHGYLFAGRGKGVRTAANGTNNANYRFHANALMIGEGDSPTKDLEDAHWAGWEMLGGGLHKDHRDYRQTTCPGPWADKMTDEGPSSGGTPMAEHNHDLTKMPDWGGAEKDIWDRFYGDGVTSVQDSWKKVAYRLDLAWQYVEVILPIKDRVSKLEAQVKEQAKTIKALNEALGQHQSNHSSGGGGGGSTEDLPDHVHEREPAGTTGGVIRV